MIDIKAPIEQEGTKTVVKTWLVRVGDRVKKNAALVELETDKVAVEVAANADGVLTEIILGEGAEAEPGAVLGRLDTSAHTSSPSGGGVVRSTTEGAPSASLREAPPPKGEVKALSPAVRKRLSEANLDPSTIQGSGRDGRVTLEDVEKALGKVAARPTPLPPAPRKGVTRVPHDSMRLSIAEHMSRSLSTAPHVTAVFEADCSAIVAHRRAHRAELESKGASLTFTAYFVSAAATAMSAAPAVNARWFDDRIEIYDDINIGVGTALEGGGLVVPVIRRVQDLALAEIARRLNDLTERARAGKLAPADVQGGTFSISNHGISGTLIAAPIVINQPQSAILGIGKMEQRAVVRDDAIVIRPMCYVTLTIDHRVLDGAQCNAWLTKFVETIERWPA